MTFTTLPTISTPYKLQKNIRHYTLALDIDDTLERYWETWDFPGFTLQQRYLNVLKSSLERGVNDQ